MWFILSLFNHLLIISISFNETKKYIQKKYIFLRFNTNALLLQKNIYKYIIGVRYTNIQLELIKSHCHPTNFSNIIR
jgi:hypothetical protein